MVGRKRSSICILETSKNQQPEWRHCPSFSFIGNNKEDFINCWLFFGESGIRMDKKSGMKLCRINSKVQYYTVTRSSTTFVKIGLLMSAEIFQKMH